MSNLPELFRIAEGRDRIKTGEFARVLGRSRYVILRHVRLERGAAYGIRPVRQDDCYLWPVADVAALLADEQRIAAFERQASATYKHFREARAKQLLARDKS